MTTATTTSLIDCPHCGRSAQIATEGRSIHFCPVRIGKKVVSRDYAGYYDGELRASGGSYLAVEQQLDAYVYDLLESGACASAAQLDGGSDADAMAAEVAGMVADAHEMADPFVPLGVCTICGCAAWSYSNDGLLCPDHASVLDAWQSESLPADWVR